MNVVVFLSVATLVFQIRCQDEFNEEKTHRLSSELDLIDWDLEDFCEDLTEMKKRVLLNKASYKNKINLEGRFGGYVRNQTQKLLTYSKYDVLSDFERNYSVLVKPGDALLSENDWKTLVKFRNNNDELLRFKSNTNHTNFQAQQMGKHEYLNILSTTRNLSTLKTAWSEWQLQIERFQERLSPVLQLIPKAASLNDQYDSKAYWEMLTDYADGYSLALNSWEEIKPLYMKLYDFVLVRINKYYESNFTEIPVFLTGSNFGEDWSNIADIILPHPQIYHDVKSEILEMSVKDVYKLAEKVKKGLGLTTSKTQKNSWSLSVSNSSDCSPDILYYCANRRAEVVSCQNTGWPLYFTSHENAIEIALKSSDYTSLPREEFRYSFIDDAITDFGPLFAMHNLPYYGLLDGDVFTNHENSTTNQMTALLLLALKVLPKLPFYLAVDMWRLDELERPSDDMVKNWWEARKKYQSVQGVLNIEADFMGDPYIINNKPYLSKFLGTLLQFQILSFHQHSLFQETDNIADRFGEESDFKTTIQEKPVKQPLDVLNYNYGFDGVNHYQLLDFFSPLEEYLNTAPLEQAPIIKKPKKPKYVEPPPEVITELENANTTIGPHDVETQEIPVQNDQHVPASDLDEERTEEVNDAVNRKVGVTTATKNVKQTETETPSTVASSSYSGGMYIAITVGACLLIVLVVFIFKRVARMKRPQTNNRRFEA